MTTTQAATYTRTYARRGNGAAIHIGTQRDGRLDSVDCAYAVSHGAPVLRAVPSATKATCKACIRINGSDTIDTQVGR